MIGRNSACVLLGIVLALAAFTGVANATVGVSCTNPVSGTVTCTGGAGAEVNDVYSGTYTLPIPTVAAQTGFGTTIAVSGGGAAVKTVSITLNGYTSRFDTANNYYSSADMSLLLVSPSGRNMEVLRGPGYGSNAQNSMTVTLADGGATIPNSQTSTTPWTTSGTYAPCSYPDDSQNEPNYASVGAPALQHAAASNGTSTLDSVNGVFTGDTINGDWKLYLVSDTDLATDVKFTSWSITITYTQASTPTTTTLTPNSPTAYTSGANSSITLIADVSGSGGTPTGTITFRNGANSLTCSQGNPVALSGGSASCTTAISSEGLQSLSASYSGDSTFVGSSGTANVFTYNHATNAGTTYCNTGTVSTPGLADVAPYPSVIYVGDGVNTSLGGDSVSTVSVTLKNFSSNDANGLHMLLVSPDGGHALDFWGEAGGGAASAGNYTLQDGASAFPNSPISPGTYAPTTNFTFDTFTLGSPIPSPAPQPPTSFSLAEPAGSKTFETSFVGATANGAWLLFVDNEGTTQTPTSTTASLAGGWCIDITPATGHPTTVAVQASTTQATRGSAVQFTATVGSSPAVGNTGQVTFTENGTPLTGAPNSGVASVSGGVATISTSSLPEGDHTITASYHDSTGTYNDNFGTKTMRVDAATVTPTLNGSTWSYCNNAGITIPAGTVFTNDVGPAAPNPSNIFVTNLPGDINAVSLTVNSFNLEFPGDFESLLVGPNGGSAPTARQTLDFFSPFDDVNLTPLNHGVTFADAYSPIPAGAAYGTAVGTQVGPTSNGATSYTASPFYTLPSTYQHATSQGSFTFNTGTYSGGGGGVYTSTLGNGTWSLYFDLTTHHTGDSAASWCMNFTENPVTVNATKTHTGSSPSNHFVQGEQGAQFNFTIANQGPGPTGDPDGNHPLQVEDTLDSRFTYASFTGTDWSCGASAQVVTCVNHDAIAQDASYPALAINVNVSNTAATGSLTNTATVSGGGATSTSPSDSTIVIDAAPVLSVTKGHTGTFTQGQTAEWDITVNNIAADSNTAGPTNVSDTLPGGYTISSTSGTGWDCSTSTSTTLNCTSTQVVSGGASFNTIKVMVNVPAASPVSVSNTASAWGGGDLSHTSLGTAATGSDSVTVVQTPASITINNSGTPQSTQISTAFGTALSVTVKDAASVVINNSSVTFTAPASGASGQFDNSSNTKTLSTNGSGVANAGTFTANATGGAYTVGVSDSPATAVNFNLTNVALPTFSKAFGVSTIAVGGTTTLTFTLGNPTGNATLHNLSFSDPLPSGVAVAATPGLAGTCVTGSNGNVTAAAAAIGYSNGVLTAGSSCTIQVNVVANTAGSKTNTSGALTSTETPTSTVTASAGLTVLTPTQMSANTGATPQSAQVTQSFGTALGVTVLDASNTPVPGVNVTFTAPGSGASGVFSNSTATIVVVTNASGVASAPFTANSTAGGPYTVSATATGLTTVNFSLSNTAGSASSMTANAGTTPQSAAINTAFANALAVTVKDAGSNPVSGVNVTFTAPGTGASGLFSNSAATITVATNASGVASATFTANSTAGGPYTVTAAAAGLTTVNFSLSNTAGAASSMTANAGTTPQSAAINTAFANALAVTVKDAGSNPVSGVNVTFTAPGSGASGVFSTSTAIIVVATNASGVASAPFTANSTTGGPYTVTAAASGLTTVNFSLSNTAGAAASMTANAGTTPQSATISTAFANALAVTVKDAGSNPVSGVNVTFTAPGSGASGTFSNSTATITVATNASGVASAPFTANSTSGGPYNVTASAAGLTSVTFSLTNTVGAAASMTANAGTTPQSATVVTAFANPLSVTVKDAGGNPIVGANVTFVSPGNGLSVVSGIFADSGSTIILGTNSSGVASAAFTANAIAGGPYTVTASTSGLPSVSFTLTNLAGPPSRMSAVSGSTPQSANTGAAFANPLAVIVTDTVSNPLSGVNVTFTAPASGASGVFSNSTTAITVATDATGVASAPFTANSTVGGPYTVTAAAAGLTTVNFSLTNTPAGPGPPIPDNFNDPSLDPEWTFVNPVGNGSYSLNGSELSLVVPGGSNHDPTFGGADNSVRVEQPIANADFDVEVKFDSIPTQQYSFEGLLVEQDAADYLRLQFGSNGSSLMLGASRILSHTETSQFSSTIMPPAGTTSLWMRVQRVGNTWTISWSPDGSIYYPGGTFTQALTVADIALFAGNYGVNPATAPAFTAKVDSFVNTPPPATAGPPVADDFNSPSLNTALWSFVNPVGNGSTSMTGTELSLVVPGGSNHDPAFGGTDNSVRVLQPISSADFEVEVKFDSIPHLQYQFEGILAQQDPANYLRLQFGSTGSAVTLSASKILSHTETAQFSSNLTLPSGTTSLWMRVQKAGSTWTISWSPDGTTYHTGGSFTQALTISDIGLFAGNYAVNPSSAPAFTALADYFHNVSATAPGPPVADSFNSGSLNTALWSFVNPVGDGSYSLNGSELLLVVPAGANHDPTFGGTDNSLRVVQTIANGDFGVVVKFDSIPTLQYQFEGLLVEQDSANFLRLQLGSNGSSLVFGASRIVSGTETSVFSNNITPATGTTSLWLKVVRSGSTWTVSWSADGTTFQSGPAFTQALTVSDIGPFAGNYKPTPSAAPAFTAKIDSFSTLSLD